MSDYKYYDSELEIDGTADDLYRQVRNGYYDNNIPAMEKIANIIAQDRKINEISPVETLDNHRSRYILANIELQKELNKEDVNDNSVAFYKFLMDIENFKDDMETRGSSSWMQIGLEEQEHDYETVNNGNIHSIINGIYDMREDKVIFSVSEYRADIDRENASAWTYDEIKDWKGLDFNRALNELFVYAQEIEREEEKDI